MATLLFFSRDPGPTNQLVALYEMLMLETDSALLPDALAPLAAAAAALRIVVRAKPPGDQVWRWAGVEPLPWPDDVGSDDALALWLRREAVKVLVTGTSDVDDETDRRLWRAARAAAVESHALLDHPANLDRRFRDRSGLSTMPDSIYAPDDGYVPPLVAGGIPSDRLRVAGDLHLNRLARQKPTLAGQDRRTLRRVWGARQHEVVVLFASECAAEMAAAGRPSPCDEFATLARLVTMIEHGALIAGVSTLPDASLIVVRPHPRDRAGKYDEHCRSVTPRVIVSSAGSPVDAILAADIVVGMNSTLLREASMLGRPVASLTGAVIV